MGTITPVLLLVAALACRQGAETEAPGQPLYDYLGGSTPSVQPTAEAVGSRGDPSADAASSIGGSDSSESVRAMVETYTTIVVATVTVVDEARDTYSVTGRELDPPIPAGRVTLLRLNVEDVISSPRVKDGDTIRLGLPGIVEQQGDQFVQFEIRLVQKADGSVTVERDPTAAGRPVFQAGARYLFFLWDVLPLTGEEGFGLPLFGRWTINDLGFVLPNGSECSRAGPREVSGVTAEQCQAAVQSADPEAALAALQGQTLEEAKQKILAAIAEAPLPPSPTPVPTPTSAPVSAAQ